MKPSHKNAKALASQIRKNLAHVVATLRDADPALTALVLTVADPTDVPTLRLALEAPIRSEITPTITSDATLPITPIEEPATDTLVPEQGDNHPEALKPLTFLVAGDFDLECLRTALDGLGATIEPFTIKMPTTSVKATKAPTSGTNECLCGCGGMSKKTFAPGHDMRLKGRIVANTKAGRQASDGLTEAQWAYASTAWAGYVADAEARAFAKLAGKAAKPVVAVVEDDQNETV